LRTVLGERNKNADSGWWGGLRNRAGRKNRSAVVDARAVNTILRDVEPRNHLNQLFQRLSHDSHIDGYTVIRRSYTPVNPNISVVIPLGDPPPSSTQTVEDVPEEIAPEPAPEYTARSLRIHARQERTVEDRAEDRPTRRRGPY